MDPSEVIKRLDWHSPPLPPHRDRSQVWLALNAIATGKSEAEVARGVAALEDAASNGHAAALYPVADPAAATMLAVVAQWRAEARSQALVSLIQMLSYEIPPGYETYERGEVEVDVEAEIHRHVANALPLLRSIGHDKQPWRNNRRLAIELVELITEAPDA